MSEQQFLLSFLKAPADEPGLVRLLDGTVWIVNPDLSRDQVGAGGAGAVLAQPFSLTAEQIRASTLTPQTVVEAPGANKMLVPFNFAYAYTFVTTPYSEAPIDLVFGPLDLNSLFSPLDASEDEAGWALGHAFEEAGPRATMIDQPVQLASNLRGAIASVDPEPGVTGTGYVVGDTGTVDDGVTLATYVIDEIGPEGAVVAFSVTDGGDGYILGAGRSATEWPTTPGGAQPGVGTGLVVQVESIDASGDPGDGTLAGVVYYAVADV